MSRKTWQYTWNAKIKRQSLPELQRLAGDLGFIVTTPGTFEGTPSAPQFLDALANAYRADPEYLVNGLRALGVAPEIGK